MSTQHLNDAINSEFRLIEIHHGMPETQSLFPSNSISTSKYSLISFFPKNIFEQFHRVANI